MLVEIILRLRLFNSRYVSTSEKKSTANLESYIFGDGNGGHHGFC